MVVDDHALIRRIIRDVLWQEKDLEIVAEACNGFEAEKQAAKTQPDIVLMDLDMPGCGGLEATERILACSPCSRIIILTASRCEHHAVSAIQHGAVGYLTKDVEPEMLIHAVRCAVREELYLSRPLASRVLANFRSSQLPTAVDALQQRITLASKNVAPRVDAKLSAGTRQRPSETLAAGREAIAPTIRGTVSNVSRFIEGAAQPGNGARAVQNVAASGARRCVPAVCRAGEPVGPTGRQAFIDLVRRGFKKREIASGSISGEAVVPKHVPHTTGSFKVKLIGV